MLGKTNAKKMRIRQDKKFINSYITNLLKNNNIQFNGAYQKKHLKELLNKKSIPFQRNDRKNQLIEKLQLTFPQNENELISLPM